MKISKLLINNHNQFKNLELDFTYPNGHEKAGQPLDKVCFIGQSGTGKTSLLEIFNNCISLMSEENEIDYDILQLSTDVGGGELHFTEKESVKNNDQTLIFFKSEVLANFKVFSDSFKEEKEKQFSNLNMLRAPSPPFYGNEGWQSKIYKFDSNTKPSVSDSNTDDSRTIVFSDSFNKKVWQQLFNSIETYDKQFQIETRELAQKISSNSDLEKIKQDFETWKTENPNPRIKIAEECLTPLLNHFNLTVNPEGNANVYFSIQHRDGTDIPSYGLSTGTKQLMLTALPIYLLNTTGSIILFDEPERSLFPDIQLQIIDYYTKLAPLAQFFYSTHSPVIAAAFEPYERFILQFDEQGHITSDSVRKGEAPIGDDPNDVLSRDFETNYINEHGVKQWEYYLELKSRLRQEKDEGKKQALMQEAIKLGNIYNYEV